jgi:serine phosphatase RsbU (regulator of sigma subunit)
LATEGRAPLSKRRQTQLILTLAFMAAVVALLIVAGIYVWSTLRESFRDAERIRTARVHVADMLRGQLDEETGVRGYVAAHDAILLAPYYDGRAALPASFAHIRTDLNRLRVPEGMPTLLDAIEANRQWLSAVATPLIVTRGNHARVELRGKTLVDRFRHDTHALDATLAQRAVSINERAQRAVVSVGGFALMAIAAVVMAASIFSIQQYRLGVRLENERAASEIARRRSAEARAAYEAEKRVADVLQEAFADRLFPVLPTLTFSATYVPATEQTRIGGDWYDALQLSADRVLLAIGDVTGHGIDAVVAMNTARQLLIGYALLDATPASVLQRVNAGLLRRASPIITAVSAVLDTRTGEFTYAVAGHPPPVLVQPDGHAKLLEFGQLPLGVSVGSEYRTHRVQTAPGAMIVLYTDGLIEYSRDLAKGEAALLEAAESAAKSPAADAAANIRDHVFSDSRVADDVAILTIRISEEALSGQSAARRIA